MPTCRSLTAIAIAIVVAGCDPGYGGLGRGLTPSNLPASRLAIVAEPPINVAAGSPISPAVVVAVQNSNGATVVQSDTTVTIQITQGTGASGAVLSGGTSVAINGLATFNNLRINLAGNGYTLTASAQGLTAATTATFNVSP